jgi:hypothetical protein
MKPLTSENCRDYELIDCAGSRFGFQRIRVIGVDNMYETEMDFLVEGRPLVSFPGFRFNHFCRCFRITY